MGVISPWHWITWRRWLMQWSGPSPSELSFQLAEVAYKKEERKGVEGQTTMHTSIAADYIRRSVSVRVKWSADVVLLGLKFKSAQLRMPCCVGGSGYQAMKRMEHVKSKHQLATTPRIWQQFCHRWPTRQDTLPNCHPNARQRHPPTSPRPLSLIGKSVGLADIETHNNQYKFQAGTSDANNPKTGC